MLVKYWMKKEVATVDVNDSMRHAISVMKERSQPLLPVLEKGKLVGIISDRDIKRASASDATALEIHEVAYLISRIKAREIMTKDPVTVPPDYTLEEAAAQMLIHNISGMPVLDKQGNILGMISRREICLALITLTGFGKRGIQLALDVEDRPGSVKEVTDIIRDYGGRVVRLLTSHERVEPGHRRVYVRAWAADREKMSHLIEDLRSKATLLYLVDHRDSRREEYVEQRWT